MMPRHARRLGAPIQVATTRLGLSAPRQRLIELLQRIQYGRVEGLQVRDGEPVLDPAPVVFREIKFASAVTALPAGRDFVLKGQHTELFNLLDEVGTGSIALLTVKCGLPFSAIVAEAAA